MNKILSTSVLRAGWIGIITVMIIGCTMPLIEVPETVQSYTLTETYTLHDSGFRLSYPTGWFTGSDGSVSIICEFEEDLKQLLIDNTSVSGYCLSHDHRGMRFMQSIGLPAEPTLDDLLQLNTDFFSYQDPEIFETTVFGVPALQVQTISDTGPEIALMGFLRDEVFLLSLGAPTEEALQEFLPTWDKIIDGIEKVENP